MIDKLEKSLMVRRFYCSPQRVSLLPHKKGIITELAIEETITRIENCTTLNIAEKRVFRPRPFDAMLVKHSFLPLLFSYFSRSPSKQFCLERNFRLAFTIERGSSYAGGSKYEESGLINELIKIIVIRLRGSFRQAVEWKISSTTEPA